MDSEKVEKMREFLDTIKKEATNSPDPKKFMRQAIADYLVEQNIEFNLLTDNQRKLFAEWVSKKADGDSVNFDDLQRKNLSNIKRTIEQKKEKFAKVKESMEEAELVEFIYDLMKY